MGVYLLSILAKAGGRIWYPEKQKAPWLDFAGAYAIQHKMSRLFIKGIEGDYYNVVGLPVARLYRELKKRES